MHVIHYKQNVPISLPNCWDFFSTQSNLKILTPPFLGFSDFSIDEPMYEGQIILHQLRPLFGIPVKWVTEITHIKTLSYFIDEQRFGPYKFWHHEHRFREISHGVEIEDIIHYLLPFGMLGKAFHYVKIRRDIARIFSYRQQKIKELFGDYPA